jgi:multiple sugar transport system substrate-binding protein
VVKNYAGGWASRQGAAVEVVRYDPEAVPPDGPDADAWLISPEELPRWAAAGKLAAVPAAYTTPRGGPYEWENVLPLYRNKLLVWGGTVYALPLLGESPLCFYRTDLVESENHQADFQKQFGRPLAPPATWEEFEEVARFFNGRKEAGFDGPSLPPLPAADDALDREFYAVAAPFARRAVPQDERKPPPDVETFSFHYDMRTAQPRINTPGFVRALQLLQRLQDYRPEAAAAEAAEAFARGQAVLCLADATWIKRFQAAAVRDKFAACGVPGAREVFPYAGGQPQAVPGGNRVAYLGAAGRLAVVRKDAPQADAAFALLAELSGPATSRQVVIEPAWGGGALRAEQFNRPQEWYSFGLSRERTTALVDALRQTLDPQGVRNPVVLRLRTPDERAHRQALLEELRPALAPGAGPDKAKAALDAAARRWQELDGRKDLDTRKAEYLRSLSLQPD